MIVADEPTSRLDLILRRDTVLLLHGLTQERGVELVLVSYDPALVRSIADDAAALG